MSLWKAPWQRFVEVLREEKLHRAYFVTESDAEAAGGFRVRASHRRFEDIATLLAEDRRDFDRHEGLFFEIGRESGHLLAAHLHWTFRGQGAGGLRYWGYESFEDFVRDGLRLSRGMGHKNALAGLWWGGGKGVIARHPDHDHDDPEVRAAVYRDYGRFVTGLRGCYITAEDVGTTPADMVHVHGTTRHTTCIPPALGGSGNPSVLTARGVVVAMEAALEHLGRGSLEGKTVAMQGLGNVAGFMIGELLDRGVARVRGVDLDPTAPDRLRERFADRADRLDLHVGTRGDDSILAEACDVLAPNAVGGILNPRTIPAIRAPLVCGAANNQLEDSERDGEALRQRGILYVPDFLANRMGIVNCANEQYGVFPGDPAIEAHLDRETPHGVYRRTLEVIGRAEAAGRSPADEAVRLAEELSRELHPIWGHRGRQIIDSLVAEGWDRGTPED